MCISFDDYFYFPALLTEKSECMAFSNLNEKLKQNILPLLSLHHRKGSKFSACREKIDTNFQDNCFFIDISNYPYFIKNLREEDKHILDPSDNYKKWVEYSTAISNAIPIAISFNNATMREVIKQAQEIEKKSKLGKVGFRVRTEIEANNIAAAIASLDDPKNAFVFIDQEYIERHDLIAKSKNAISKINIILNAFSDINVSILSSSFPKSPGYYAEKEEQNYKYGLITQKEINLYEKIISGLASNIDTDQIKYGDYAGVFPKVLEDTSKTFGRWSARIDFSNDEIWQIFKYTGPKDSGNGFSALAKEIIETTSYKMLTESWGKTQILDASKGTPFNKSLQGWVAVRINTHLTEHAWQESMNHDDDYELD